MNPPIRRESEPEVQEGALIERERRRNPRVTVPWPAIVEDSDGRRVTLPRDGGEIEIAAEVVRRDPGGIGVDFGKLPVGAAERVKAFVPTWDLRRRAERVGIELPVQIEGHAGNTHGHTVDLSSVGARVATDERLTPGDMIVVTVTPEDTQGPMRIRAVV